MEYHIFLIYQKLTVQDFNFQLFGILKMSTLRFGGSPLLFITFYSNRSGRGVISLLVLCDPPAPESLCTGRRGLRVLCS